LSKFQKIFFTLFVVVSLVLGFFGYRALKNSKQPSVKVITLIPDSCDLLLVFDNYTEFSNSLRHKNLLWQDLKGITSLRASEKYFNYFDSVLVANSFLNELVSDHPVYMAAYPGKKFLIAFNLKELSAEKKSSETFVGMASSLASVSLKAEVEGGVVAISNSGDLLKKLFDSKKTSISENKNFILSTNSANYSGTSIYVNETTNSFLIGNSYASISMKPDRIILNGIKTVDSPEFFGEIKSAPQKKMDFIPAIPLICNAFEAFAINNAEEIFSKNIKTDWWTQVNEAAMFNAKKQFYNNISDYIVKITMPSKNQALMMRVSDSLRLREILPYMKDTILVSVFLKEKGICGLLKGKESFVNSTFPVLKMNQLNYFVLVNNHLVFTVSENDAEIFANAGINNSSVLGNKKFKQFVSKNFDSEFHYMNYKLINSLSGDEIPFSDLLTSDDAGELKNISHCSFIATYKDNFLNYRFNLSYSQENFNDEPGVLWTLNADTTIITRPFLFKNHITKGNEIVFQTAGNKIYLQNATGKNIWKKQINEQIRSEIFTVDVFKNKKYQLLFNTDNYLHLIDRNGNYVQGYPMKLPAKATNKLCLFDYENKNELRLFIACADKRIYNFSPWGIRQEGFKPLSTANEVTLPIKYCKVGLSDYLVTADVKGHIYAFSRRGDGRIDFRNKLIEDAADFEIEAGNLLSNTQIIYYDNKSHLLEKISLADKKEIYKTSESESKPAYCFHDFDKNKIVDAIIAYPDKLEVYDLNGTKHFSRDLPENGVAGSVNFYNVSNNNYIITFDSINSVSFVNDIEQKTVKEFRSSCETVICDLFNDGKSYLLVVLNGELKCVKL